MNPAEAYIPIDRRLAIEAAEELALDRQGTVLFVDISGFTPFTGALVHHYGPRRGAEELTRLLNQVYSALIAEIDKYQGSVIGFSGDAITCWFDARDRSTQATTLRAIAAALAVQQAMSLFRSLQIGPTVQETHQPDVKERTFSLAVKTAIAAGDVRRFTVGVPQIQLIDVLAGTTLDRMAATEAMAHKNELVIDEESLQPILEFVTIQEWRTDHNHCRYALLQAGQHLPEPEPWPACPSLTTTAVQPWVLPAIAARIAGEQGRFLAELRPAAALFLRFTGLDFDHDPDSPAKLDRYIQWAQTIIDQQEGALIQLTTGDKGSYLYATFGAPLAHDDDIERAVAAALALRTPPAACPYIRTIQIGITYGMMRVGAYGGETRKTYGVLGPETNMAARLMVHAAPGQIVVSEVVAQTLGNRYEIAALGKHQLKGAAEPLPLYAILRSPNRLLMQPKLYESTLVGREEELACLESYAQALVDATTSERGKVVRVVGAAGLGKSHLTATFLRNAQRMGLRSIVAGGQSTAQGTAYFALRQLMYTILDLNPYNDRATGEASINDQIAQLQSRLESVNPNWIVRLPLLGDLLGIAIPDNSTTSAFDPRLRQEALTALTVEIISHYAQKERLLLVFEDVHWLDEASQGIVLALSRAIAAMPLLLLLVHRPAVRENDQFFIEVESLDEQEVIRLDELPAAGIVALVEERLKGPVAPLAAGLIQAQAQGNPFFTEELVDALVENQQLQKNSGEWQLASLLIARLRSAGCLVRHQRTELLRDDASLSSVDLGIPNTIQGIILARLDRLPEPVKLTVKVASVIGRLFDHELLSKAHPLQITNEQLEAELTTLLLRDFAKVEASTPHITYIFKHNITQEVIYQTLLTDQRHELHLGVATALEIAQPEQVEDLALHYYNSNLEQEPTRTKALHYLEAAGLRAQHDYANETALGYFDRALSLDTKGAWLKAKVQILHILGRRTEEEATLEALTADPETEQFVLALLWAEYYEAISDYSQTEDKLDEALRLAEKMGDAEGVARCRARLGMLAWRQGDYDGAEQIYLHALQGITDEGRFADEEAEIRYGLGLVYRQQGKFEEAKIAFERDLTINEKLNNRQGEARARNALAIIEQTRRNYTEAIGHYERALLIRETIGDRAGVGASQVNIAQILSAMGNYSDAEQMLRNALRIQKALNNGWWQAIIYNELGILYLTTGHLSEAREALEEGLRLSEKVEQQGIRAYLLCNLGQVLRDSGALIDAETTFKQGLALAEAQGDLHLLAIYCNDLALAYLQMAQYEEAIHYAERSLDNFGNLDLEISTTNCWAILAASHLAQQQPSEALRFAQQAIHVLDQCAGVGPDYPTRDYWMCFQVFAALGEDQAATHAFRHAHTLLQQQAQKIIDPAIRHSYLQNIPSHRAIVERAIEWSEGSPEG